MKYLNILFLPVCGILVSSCHNGDCLTDYNIPVPPYSNPTWYVDGNQLGFNYIPVMEKIAMNQGSCGTSYAYTYYKDSVGFWIINKDGSNKRRQTNFMIDNPSWSPDGKWLAYSFQGNLYKIPFDGINLDTSKIFQLTSDGSKYFFPVWNSNSDTIFFDCDKDQAPGTLSNQVWKMAADGTGMQNIGNKGIDSISTREPWYTENNLILHVRTNSKGPQICTMTTQGDSVNMITDDSDPSLTKHNPRSYGNKFFYESYGVWSLNWDGSALTKIVIKSENGFSISKDGLIAYVYFSSILPTEIDQSLGTIWIIRTDGSENQQLTFNNYITR